MEIQELLEADEAIVMYENGDYCSGKKLAIVNIGLCVLTNKPF
jgi:hypothetical protein